MRVKSLIHRSSVAQLNNNRCRPRERGNMSCMPYAKKITQPHMGSSFHAVFDNQRNADLLWLTVANGHIWGCSELFYLLFLFDIKMISQSTCTGRCHDKHTVCIHKTCRNLHACPHPSNFFSFFSLIPIRPPDVLTVSNFHQSNSRSTLR